MCFIKWLLAKNPASNCCFFISPVPILSNKSCACIRTSKLGLQYCKENNHTSPQRKINKGKNIKWANESAKIALFFKQMYINDQTNNYGTIIIPCSGWSTVLWLLGHLFKLLQGQGNISYCFIVIIIRIWFFPQIHDTPRNNEEVWLVRKMLTFTLTRSAEWLHFFKETSRSWGFHKPVGFLF